MLYRFSETIPDIFQSPEKRFYPRSIAIKFSLVIDYELKFVKMQFFCQNRYHHGSNKQKTLKSIKAEFCAI